MSFELILNKKEQFTQYIYGFWFKVGEEGFEFKPGQFLEWTLEHKNPDNQR